MKIKLFTRDAGFVHEADIPPFLLPPEVVTWGSRVFTKDDRSIVEADGSRTVRYTEGILYPLTEINDPAREINDHAGRTR